jgi:hypothetical protein
MSWKILSIIAFIILTVTTVIALKFKPCKCNPGYICHKGKCQPNFIYGDLSFITTEMNQKKASTASSAADCALQTEKEGYRFWTYDSHANLNLSGVEGNCYQSNVVPTCAVQSINGFSGDIQNKILPSTLPKCSNGCTLQSSIFPQIPQFVPGCGTDSGSINEIEYIYYTQEVPIITDSCSSVSPPNTPPSSCTSSNKNNSAIPQFEISNGKCELTQNNKYWCSPQKMCLPLISSEKAGTCSSQFSK